MNDQPQPLERRGPWRVPAGRENPIPPQQDRGGYQHRQGDAHPGQRARQKKRERRRGRGR